MNNTINFNNLIGNEVATTILQNIIINERIAPTYLFTGEVGIGKLKAASIFAQHITRSNIETLIVKPTLSDGSSGNPTIKIDQIHEAIAFCGVKPAIGKRKVVIIDAETGLSDKCSNALLKMLEEPPTHVTIIVISSQSILPTIFSRCHHVQFNRLTNEQVQIVLAFLGHNEVGVALLDAAQGSPGKALQIIEVWDKISNFIEELSIPPKTISEGLIYSNSITTLDYNCQLILLQLLITVWWRNRNLMMLQKGHTAFMYLTCKVSARNVWDNLLIPSQ